jgi:hypothetical protein
MKTILLLHDEATESTQLLQDTVPTDGPFRETKVVAKRNCDRWGHPCAGCVEQVTKPKREFPSSMPTKK